MKAWKSHRKSLKRRIAALDRQLKRLSEKKITLDKEKDEEKLLKRKEYQVRQLMSELHPSKAQKLMKIFGSLKKDASKSADEARSLARKYRKAKREWHRLKREYAKEAEAIKRGKW